MSEYYLVHHGIKGQRWGVRRYQNADGTLTEAGKKRYMKNAERIGKISNIARERKMKSEYKYNQYIKRPYILRSSYKSDKLGKKANKAAIKETEILKRSSSWFQTEMKDLSKMGLDDKQLERFSQIGKELIERQEVYDAFHSGLESAFWKALAEQLEYEQNRRS